MSNVFRKLGVPVRDQQRGTFIATAIAVPCAMVVLLFYGAALAAIDPEQGDIRDLKVGTTVVELPSSGYVDFSCAKEGLRHGPALQGWADFRRCTPNDSGIHEISFRYDGSRAQWAAVNDKWEGTKVSGHPVLLSLLISEAGLVEGVRILTDPAARLYLRKKAFLLRLRIMGRYGRDGWECQQLEPENGKTPVGGMFINETCSKRFKGRNLIMTTRLYRGAGQSKNEFTSSTRLDILRASRTGLSPLAAE